MDRDVVRIREEPQLDPEALYRRYVIDKVKAGLCLAVRNGHIRITADNISPLLSLFSINTCDEDVLDLIRDALIDTGGEIKTEDFEKVVLERIITNEEEEEKAIEDAYRIVDVDGDGIITAADIYRLMMNMGEVISDEELRQMLKMVDSDGDGRITFEEFRKFILGVEDPDKPSEELCEETESTDNAEPEEPLAPSPIIYKPPPEHKRRRSLFTYGNMIAKQLSVVAQMKNLVSSGDHQTTDEGTNEPKTDDEKTTDEYVKDTSTEDAKETDEGTEHINVKNDERGVVRDSGEVPVDTLLVSIDTNRHLHNYNDNKDCQIKTDMCMASVVTEDTRTTKEEYFSEEREKQNDNNTDLDEKAKLGSTRINILFGGCSEAFMASLEKQPKTKEYSKNTGKDDNNHTMLPTQCAPGEEVTEEAIQHIEPCQAPVVSVKKECPPTRYSEKSPYYGRIRPIVFSMYPLPEIDNSGSQRKESFSSSTTENTESDITPVAHSNGSRVVIMVDKQMQTTEQFDENIAEFVQTFSVIVNTKGDFESRLDDTPSGTLPLRRDSATITDVHGIPKRLRKMKCLENAILKRRNTSSEMLRTLSEDRVQHRFSSKPLLKRTPTIHHLQRQSSSCGLVKQLIDRSPRQAVAFAERHPCHIENREETLLTPSSPKTGFRRFRISTSPSDSMHDIDDSTNFKGISIIDVSQNINDENLYEPDVKRSEKHHGFKSIRPLARVIMALKSTYDAKKAPPEDVTSISRFLEENGTPYARTSPTFERKATVMKHKTLSRSNTLLNLELPMEKAFRPKLKKTSTLTRIPVDNGDKHNLPLFLG